MPEDRLQPHGNHHPHRQVPPSEHLPEVGGDEPIDSSDRGVEDGPCDPRGKLVAFLCGQPTLENEMVKPLLTDEERFPFGKPIAKQEAK